MDFTTKQTESLHRICTAKEWLTSRFLSHEELKQFFGNACDNSAEKLRKMGLKSITINRVRIYYVEDVVEFLMNNRV